MRGNFAKGIFCLCAVSVAFIGLHAQAATTVAYWKFDEKTPGNVVDFTTGAILDETANNHDGTAYGGDPFNDPDVNVYSRYVDGATGSADSALQMTLQDWLDEDSYVGAEEDNVFVPGSGSFNLDLTSNTVYTLEAIVRAPDPMDRIDSGIYHGTREGFDEFPQFYDYTGNSIVGRPAATGNATWVLRMDLTGRLQTYLYDGVDWILARGNTPVIGDHWHQVAAKITGSSTPANRKVQFYIDGELDGETSLSTIDNISNASSVMLGSYQDNHYPSGERWNDQFIGDIDSIRISTGTDVAYLTVPTQTVPTMNLSHTGMTDPGTEPHLKLVDASDRFAASATVTAVAGTGGDPDSWRIEEVGGPVGGDSASYAYYRGLLTPEQFNDPNGWTLTATMKLGASNKPWNTSIGVEDGRDTWVMSFMDSNFTQTSGDTGAGVYKSGAFEYSQNPASLNAFQNVVKMGTTNPTDGFHTYKMWYDPAGDNNNGMVHFYVDDVEVGTQTRAQAWDTLAGDRGSRYQSDCRFWFGDAYPLFERSSYILGDTASDAYWADVTLGVAKTPQYQPYDVNEDGFVGADDLDVVRAHWGESGPGGKAIGDINLDEFVGADDLDQLRAHWGEVCPPIPGLVPEPSTFVLLAMGALTLIGIRRVW